VPVSAAAASSGGPAVQIPDAEVSSVDEPEEGTNAYLAGIQRLRELDRLKEQEARRERERSAQLDEAVRQYVDSKLGPNAPKEWREAESETARVRLVAASLPDLLTGGRSTGGRSPADELLSEPSSQEVEPAKPLDVTTINWLERNSLGANFPEHVQSKYREFVETYGHRPTLEDLAGLFYVSRSTFIRARNKCHINCPAVSRAWTYADTFLGLPGHFSSNR